MHSGFELVQNKIKDSKRMIHFFEELFCGVISILPAVEILYTITSLEFQAKILSGDELMVSQTKTKIKPFADFSANGKTHWLKDTDHKNNYNIIKNLYADCR